MIIIRVHWPSSIPIRPFPIFLHILSGLASISLQTPIDGPTCPFCAVMSGCDTLKKVTSSWYVLSRSCRWCEVDWSSCHVMVDCRG